MNEDQIDMARQSAMGLAISFGREAALAALVVMLDQKLAAFKESANGDNWNELLRAMHMYQNVQKNYRSDDKSNLAK